MIHLNRVIVTFLTVILSLPHYAQNNRDVERYISQINEQLIEMAKVDSWDWGCWGDFKLLLMSFPKETYEYNFDNLIKLLDISFNESNDGIIKCYTFYGGAQMGECVVQYKYGGQYYSIDDGSNYYISMDKISNDTYLCYESPWRGWNSYKCCSLDIIELGDSIKVLDGLSICVDYIDKMRRTPDDHNYYFFSYDVDTFSDAPFIIYVPVIISDNNKEIDHRDTDNILSGQYDTYIIKNNKFQFVKHEGDPFIHESLKSYYRLITKYLTKRYLLRVDEMEGGSYRYASWNLPNDEEKQPSIIVYDGVYEKEKKRYKFDNKGYTYYVGDGFEEQNRYVEVWKDNKMLLRDLPSK